MRHGFIKVTAVTPDLLVADTVFNTDKLIECMKEEAAKGTKILVFPELAITGYTCGELFLQDELLEEAKKGLFRLAEASEGLKMLTFVGLPLVVSGKLYNVAAAIMDGGILGLVPKVNLPSYGEFYEGRHFTPGNKKAIYIDLSDEYLCIPFGTDIIFQNTEMPDLKIAAELCEDLWVPDPPSVRHAINGATIIVNLSGSTETTGKDIYRRELVKSQSARLICGYIYATAGEGESSTDLVFGGQNLIAENGTILAEKKRFENGRISTEIDVKRLAYDRRKMGTFEQKISDGAQGSYDIISFSWEMDKLPMIPLTRTFAKTPFVPGVKADRDRRCEEITTIQAMGLKKRLKHTHCEHVVIGVSGGLDSTLALLVACKAFDMLELPRENVVAVTMPAFGTTDRTYNNSLSLAKTLGASLREINIKAAVEQHFKDIGHDPEVHNVVYENSQARERTQVIMDIANAVGGLVIGTGDMSELALGWATYNGDHMSMYAVNCSIPKTLVRYLVLYFAETAAKNREEELSDVLFDVLDTPVSPELLPPDENGKISQKTEDIVGPYELHDFFLYHVVRFGETPDKIYRLACVTFHDQYDEKFIYKWLVNFYRRFFAQQYKRSCIPDGPKVGSVALSPRGDWRMPSDASNAIWMKKLEEIKPE